MSVNTRVSDQVVNAQADVLAVLLNGGYLRLYDGTQPDSPDSPLSSQSMLTEVRFADPAFPSAEDGVLTSYDLTPDEDAAATGDASWFRCFQADGSTGVLDGSAGRDDEPELGDRYNLNLATIHIQQHGKVSISEFVHSIL